MPKFVLYLQVRYIFVQEEISLKPFKLQDLPQESRNSSVSSRTTGKKENSQRQAWPHQRLKEMKNRKPMKKQNALLANIGSLTIRTESSTTTIQSNDSPHFKDSTTPEKVISQKESKQAVLPNCKNVNLHSKTPRSNVVQRNETDKPEQKFVDTDKIFTQAKNVTRDSVSTRMQTVESSEPPQSTRSTSSAGNKSKLTSKKPPTKTLHLGKWAYLIQ